MEVKYIWSADVDFAELKVLNRFLASNIISIETASGRNGPEMDLNKNTSVDNDLNCCREV